METKHSSIIGWSVFAVVVWSVIAAVMLTEPSVEADQPPVSNTAPASQTQLTRIG